MKVLLVKTSSLGDVIHTFQAVEDARRALPGLQLDWCVEEPFAGIAALHPFVATVHPVELRRWRKAPFGAATRAAFRVLRQRLKAERYDLVIDAQGLFKSALVARGNGAPVAGLDFSSAREPLATLAYQRRYHVPKGLHAIERTRRLFGLALGYEPDFFRLVAGILAPALPAGLAMPDRAAFLLHGTTRDDKKWRIEDWVGMARLAAARGLTPLATWSNEAERAVAQAIAAGEPGTMVVEKSPLTTVAALLARSAMVAGADTGLTHLAAAFGVPTVAIFLATQPGLTGPRGEHAATLAARPDRPVTPQTVMDEAERLMAARDAAA